MSDEPEPTIADLIEIDNLPTAEARAITRAIAAETLPIRQATVTPKVAAILAHPHPTASGITTTNPAQSMTMIDPVPGSLQQDLSDAAVQSRINAATQGIGSMAGGQLAIAGFTTRDGYITAIRNGVPARTYHGYIETLRSRWGMTSADITALALPGPMVVADLPVGAGITHTPTGPSVFDRPRSQRQFVVGPKADTAEAAPVVKLEHGTMIAGAIAEGHGVLVGWSGRGKLTRGALVAAIAEHDVKPPQATSARAQAGRVMSALTGSGYVVRISRGGGAVTQWTVGTVNHKSAVGSELGQVEMRASLAADGTLSTEGSEALGAKVQTEFRALVAEELYQAGDVTSWLCGVLASRFDAVRFGVGWYVPARHAAAAGALCESVSKIFGADWIVPALPVATSDQLRDGIVRGLTSEVDGLMARMATEREMAKVAKADALSAAMALTDWRDAHAKAIKLAGDIGPKRAQTFLTELRAIGARIVAYGQVLGEERLASAKEQVRQAVVELETVLGDDYTGIAARFAGVWDEIESDRKRAGGVL